MKPLLSLVGIFKNEASNIRKVLEAAKPFIDSWHVYDTGSQDGTQGIVREVMDGVPGELHEGPFEDFATARNKVLDFAAKDANPTEFQLMISGDEYLRNGEALRTYLESHRDSDIDCHLVRLFLDDSTFLFPRVLRTGSAWRYEGIIHEYPANPDPTAKISTVPDAYIDHIVSDPEKRLSNIWENHIPLLKAELLKNPNSERTLIFLAQSYDALIPYMDAEERKDFATLAAGLYTRRLAIPTGSDAERNNIEMRALDDARIAELYSDQELFDHIDDLAKRDPKRPETALLHATAAWKVLPAQKVYELAAHAAEISLDAWQIDNTSPISTSCGWQAHLLSATAAKRLAEKYPEEFGPLVKQHIDAGLAVGGPEMMFNQIGGKSQ